MATEKSAEMNTEIEHPSGQRLRGVLTGELGDYLTVSCHGMLSHCNGPKHRELARLLTEQGVANFRFDFRGRGMSDGPLEQLTISRELEDLDLVVDHFYRLGVQRFGLFGSSIGGVVVLLCAGHDERIVRVTTLAAPAHPDDVEHEFPDYYRQWTTQGYLDTPEGRIGRGFLDDAVEHNVLGSVGVLRCPVLVYHGTEDKTVCPSNAHDIASAARNVRLEMVEGADHFFAAPAVMRSTLRDIADFLARR